MESLLSMIDLTVRCGCERKQWYKAVVVAFASDASGLPWACFVECGKLFTIYPLV